MTIRVTAEDLEVGTTSRTTDQPVTVQVVETPAERLRRLALVPDLPRQDLWEAIAQALIDVNERLITLEAEADDRATWTARGGPVQPG